LVTWTLILDIIQDVRGSISMFMFIIEEAIQTVGMAIYLLYKQGKYQECLELVSWELENLINPSLEFVEQYGAVAYPLNIAYQQFYQSAKKTALTYQDLCLEALSE